MKANEIEVLENMIRLLNKCLVISFSKGSYKDALRTLADIRKCKTELRKLLEQRKDPVLDAEKDMPKEQEENAVQ